MAAYEVLLLNTAIPQIQAAQSGDTYVVPRDIAFSAAALLANGTNSAPSLTFSSDTDTGIFRPATNQLGFATAGVQAMTLDAAGNFYVGTTSQSGGSNITFNQPANADMKIAATASTGTRAAYQVFINTTVTTVGTENSTGGSLASGTAAYATVLANNGAYPICFATSNAEKMRLDSSGNLGLGVTPSAWVSRYKIFQAGNQAAFAADNTFNTTSLGTNWCETSGGDTYIGTGRALRYSLQGNTGNHAWFNAASGNANDPISFTQAMTLDALGNLGIGTTTPNISGGAAGSQILTVSASAAGRNGILELNGTRSTSGDYVGYVRFFNNAAATPGADIQAIRGASDTEATLAFATSGTERARITSGGAFLVGTNTAYTTAADTQIASKSSSGTGFSHFVLGNSTQGYLYVNIADVYTWNNAASVLYTGSINSTGRSINASGTVNASGADYAEYMTKAGNFTIAKGDVCGVDADGNLTNVFANAVSFVVKSTNPSYVGGDTWGVGLDKDSDELQAARQKVDRVAFAGQVPVNVMGAKSGQYIVPVNDNGAIKGVAKDEADMTLAEYMKAVGKVIAIESDGRARIIVKVS